MKRNSSHHSLYAFVITQLFYYFSHSLQNIKLLVFKYVFLYKSFLKSNFIKIYSIYEITSYFISYTRRKLTVLTLSYVDEYICSLFLVDCKFRVCLCILSDYLSPYGQTSRLFYDRYVVLTNLT